MVRLHVCMQKQDVFEDALRMIAGQTALEITCGEAPLPGAVNLGFGEDALPGDTVSRVTAWEGGCLIEGSDLFFTLSALLQHVRELEDGLPPKYGENRRVFDRCYQNYDDCSFAFSRCADGFDLDAHMLEMVRMGVQSMEINLLPDDISVQVRERAVPEDKYQWWTTYSAALDMYYESPLTRGTYDPRLLARNREKLLDTARRARALGIKPIFCTFEPRAWPERLLRRYPDLRGARVDHPAYSCEPEYAPDVNHPLVRRHYACLMEQLMRDVPDLDMIEIWSQDSNAGFPWAKCLYSGENGPIWARRRPLWETVNRFASTLKEAAAKVNPATRVHLNLSWVFMPEEKQEIMAHLPADIHVSAAWRDWEYVEGRQEESFLLEEGIGCNWKRYAPLLGFPYPKNVFKRLCEFRGRGVRNLIMRGGIVPPKLVPRCVNSEVIRAFAREGDALDLSALLRRCASAWTDTPEEAGLMLRAWDLCDAMDARYDRGIMCWTAPMFVSSRTLFRRMVSPIVPDPSLLSVQETRYFRPYVFLTLATDPSWYDASFFNFEQKTSDERFLQAVARLDEQLLPPMEECVRLLSGAKSPLLADLRDRVECFLLISRTERDLMEAQVEIHRFKADGDEAHRRRIRALMESDIATTERFIALLQRAEHVLIPTTSGEETPYMFKTPLWPTLQEKIRVMKRHMDDEPGPHFEEGMYYLGGSL